jgi:hypothetical protein
MQTPPPVSGAAYSTTPISEVRSNYVRGGMTFETAYSDNILGGTTSHPLSDVSYSIWPTVALDESTPRLHWVFFYGPGVTLYQHTSSEDQADQNLNVDFQYRLSPHVTLSLRDSFQKASSFFNQPDLISAADVTGGVQGSTVVLIPPIADRLTNKGNADITYQFSANAMVGAGGTFTNLHYPNPAEVPGLYDSSSAAGTAFYSRRLSAKHYMGVTYQYQRFLAYPVAAQSDVESHSAFLFYTVFLKPTLSLSFSGGPQHADIYLSPLPSSQLWSPAGTASLGWQGQHTGFAVSYARIISGGGGLLGAFRSNSANATLRRQLSRNWSTGLTAHYSIEKAVTPSILSSPGGHAYSGTASLGWRLGPHVSAQAGYTRLHQAFSNIIAISAPDVNREWVSISYHFEKPLGR